MLKAVAVQTDEDCSCIKQELQLVVGEHSQSRGSERKFSDGA